MSRRIEKTTSRTAEWTCLTRAASSVERMEQYKSKDDIALLLVPTFFKWLLKVSFMRRLFTKMAAPRGIYEYVIARTKYIDDAFDKALEEQFDQILIFGAGFDTRSLRFHNKTEGTKIFELDVPITQKAKTGQYHRRGLHVPSNVIFIPIDFDRDSLPQRLDEAGFKKDKKNLFILEGLLMYLQPESVDETLKIIRAYSGDHSRIVFDYVYASVLRQENLYYGEKGIFKSVSKAKEQWNFGIEKGDIDRFLKKYDFVLLDHKDSEALEKLYFKGPDGKPVGRINGTHCLVTAEKKEVTPGREIGP